MDHDGVDSFSVLPPPIIQQIAVAACSITQRGPPSELARLLQVSRRVYGALCVQHSPGVHAQIFSVKFDSGAAARRFADAGEPLVARNFAHELRRRWVSLKRIRSVANAGKLLVCSEENALEDLWMVYLMCIESDGRNIDQLYWARAAVYVRTVIRDNLMPTPRPGYMVESTARTLGLWLMWLFSEVTTVAAETPQEVSYMFSLLRPWALGSHKYDILLAPYTHWALPVPEESDFEEDLPVGARQFLADLDVRDRTDVVMYMARRIRLAPPRGSIAAIMALMVRVECHGPITRPVPHAPNTSHPGLEVYPRTRYPALYGPGSLEFDDNVNRLGSATYDAEWRRILQCGNPFATPKFKTKPLFKPGELLGSWEGRSVFLSSDEFRDVLNDVAGMITRAPLVQQALVWHIREHHLVSRRRRFPLGGKCDAVTGEKLPVGQALNAFIPQHSQFIYHNKSSEPGSHRLEVRVPDANIPLGYKSYTYTTLDEPGPPPTQPPAATVVFPSDPLLRAEDTGSSLKWDPPRPPTLGDGDDQFDEDILDTLVTGEGHSSLGSFKLRGRIRPWDGMIILLKEYDTLAAHPHGRWLYRGYIVSGANWIGRWRDTTTAERLIGYEGLFSVTRQS